MAHQTNVFIRCTTILRLHFIFVFLCSVLRYSIVSGSEHIWLESDREAITIYFESIQDLYLL